MPILTKKIEYRALKTIRYIYGKNILLMGQMCRYQIPSGRANSACAVHRSALLGRYTASKRIINLEHFAITLHCSSSPAGLKALNKAATQKALLGAQCPSRPSNTKTGNQLSIFTSSEHGMIAITSKYFHNKYPITKIEVNEIRVILSSKMLAQKQNISSTYGAEYQGVLCILHQ